MTCDDRTMKRQGNRPQQSSALTTVIIVAAFGLAALMVLKGYEPIAIIVVVSAVSLIAAESLSRNGNPTPPMIEDRRKHMGGRF
jgi:hypothetical protein